MGYPRGIFVSFTDKRYLRVKGETNMRFRLTVFLSALLAVFIIFTSFCNIISPIFSTAIEFAKRDFLTAENSKIMI